MAYVDYEYYKTLYGEKAIQETDFKRLLWDAEREIDKTTSGVDGVRKLQVAFPTNEEDAETVKRCVCALQATSPSSPAVPVPVKQPSSR